jgi:CheY-like chemotaxis protein
MGMVHSRGKVLIVDDDQEWIEALTDFLVEEGYSVTSAPNGLAALQKLSQTDPLVVITDVEMPIMDGRQLLVRVHEENGRMPVIVVTAERAQRDNDAGLAGAFRIIRKPVPVQDLLAALSEAAAHRVAHLPLQKLWRAAGAVSHSCRKRVSRIRWPAIRRVVTSASAAPIVVLLLLASSFVLYKRWRGVA